MKVFLQNQLATALKQLAPQLENLTVEIERSRDPAHGHFASNVALKYAKSLGLAPRALAEQLISALGTPAGVARLEVAGAGFINIHLAGDLNGELLGQIVKQGAEFGRNASGAGTKILLEFVSANPNGPLHVGHGRGAGYGASLANVLRANGYTVDCEYYVNDAGRQMDILALSSYWRYLQALGWTEELPPGIYQGDYVKAIGAALRDRYGESLKLAPAQFLPDFANDEENRDRWIDQAIGQLRAGLGAENYQKVFAAGLDSQLADIQEDLRDFGVIFDNYYSEKSLFTTGKIDAALAVLQEKGFLYEENGALWFKSQQFGDEKDRVVRRDNGQTTYFASDIAYHWDKFQRGYDLAINIWGADHHGYIARVKAALAALGLPPEKLVINLVQFAVLYANGEKVQMSTRAGKFVTLRQLRETVGSDCCRFFYAMRKADNHLDFDIDLARSNSKENPYYYVQYANTRANRVLEKAAAAGFSPDWESALEHVSLLGEEKEQLLLRELGRYGDVLAAAGRDQAPHLIINYLKELAGTWHQYYDAGYKLIHEDEKLRAARLLLTFAVRQLLRNGLELIGVRPLDSM